MRWVRVYDLHRDMGRIAQLQEASQNKPGLGLSPEPALVGSDEWWAMVEDGRLAHEELTGTITQVLQGSMDDLPAFEVTTDSDVSSTWYLVGDLRRYREGERVHLSYVLHPWKEPNRYGFEGSRKLITLIELAEND